MKTFRWFSIVAVLAAIGLVERTAYAQGASSMGVAVAENMPLPSAPTVPADAVTPPASAVQAPANCQAACNGCGDIPKWHVFGEYLLLRPRNEGVEYAVPINGNIVADQVPLQVGPTGVVDPQFQSGFRIGFERVLSECSSISLAYTYYRNDANDGPGNGQHAVRFASDGLQSLVRRRHVGLCIGHRS